MKTIVVGTNDKIPREVAVVGTRAMMHSRDDPTLLTWLAEDPRYRTVVFLRSGNVQTVRTDRIRHVRDTGGVQWETL